MLTTPDILARVLGELNLTSEQFQKFYDAASPEDKAEIDLMLTPSLAEIESDWRIWLKTLFPQFVRGEWAGYHVDYFDWLWKALWSKRKNEPLPDRKNAYMTIWPRGGMKSTLARLVPIAEAALLGQGYALYVSGGQDQANKHLTSIETLLTSDKVRYYYPQMGRPKVGNTDRSKAWNQKMLHTASGFVLQAIGLDVGIRGANVDDMRISTIVIDDIDERTDTPLQSDQKLDKLLHSILPTKKGGTIFICAQNLVVEHGCINRIVTGQVGALANAIISGPHVRIKGLETRQETSSSGRPRDVIIAGTATWPADSIERCQEDIDDWTLPVFQRECQHELQIDRSGLVLKNWEDKVHVITESEFAKVYGHRSPPPMWNKYIGHDWAKTHSAYHANVCIKVAVASQNEPLPGTIFIYDAMSFPEGTSADDVAVRLLESIASTVEVRGQPKTWDTVLRAEFQRENLDEFISSATELMSARRRILAKVVPPVVGPLLKLNHYRHLRMSHEMKDVRNVYRTVFGLPFVAANPKREGGLEFINHYMRVDHDRPHPFRKDRMGRSQVYLIVPDHKAEYPVVFRPEVLHDSDLARYQFRTWRYAAPHLTNTGILDRGPEKMNDDMGQALMMIFYDNCPAAEPLSYAQKIEEMIPQETRLQTLLQPSSISLTGRRTMTASQQLSYEIAREFAKEQIRPKRRRQELID